VLVGLGLAALFAAALFRVTLSETRVECEACIEFAGRLECRSVAAADREHAIQQAVSTACAVLVSGVTAGLECQRSVPRSLSCRESSQ
jgi:hypothetical protein